MKIDTTNLSAHVIVDRKMRIDLIENTIGWGDTIATIPDKHNTGTFATLTSTGVMIISTEEGFILTAWVANVKQAVAIWKTANGEKPMPRWLWKMIHYNNNTETWQKMAA